MISAAEISITFFLSVLVSLYCSNFKTTLMVLDLCLHFVCHLFYSSPQLLLSTQLRKIGNVPFKKECYIVTYFSTGGPGSSCEIIILRNESWRIYKSLNGIFTTALRNKKNTINFSIKIPHLTSTVHRLLSDLLVRLLC